MSELTSVPPRRATGIMASAFAQRSAPHVRRPARVLPLGAVALLAALAGPAGAQMTAVGADTSAGTTRPVPRPSAAEPHAPPSGDATRRPLVGAAYLTAGGSGLPLGALDTRLRAAGLPGTSAGARSLGSGAYAVLARRLVVGASGHVLLAGRTEHAGWQTRVGGGYALGEVGIAAVATSRTLLAVTGGLGASRVTAKMRPLAGGRFDSVAVSPRRSVELGSHTPLAHAGLMADHAVRWRGKRTVVVGLRAGWMGNVGDSKWRADDAALVGGPTVAPRGAYARLTVGAPLGRRREALLPALGPALPWLTR
jgi:hypothetical protein